MLDTILIFLIDLIVSLSSLLSIFIMWIINSFVSFFNKNSGFVSILLTLAGVYVAWKIYKKTHRPVIFIEINVERDLKDVKEGRYYLNVSNVGNVLAKKVSISCSNEEIDKLFKPVTQKNAQHHEYTKKTFQKSFNQTINYLSFKNDRNGYLFGHYQKNESSDSINFDVEFKVNIVYYDYLTNLKYTDTIIMSITNDMALTGHYLMTVSEDITHLKDIKRSIDSLPFSINFKKTNNEAYQYFVNSLKEDELLLLKDIVKSQRNTFFQEDEINQLTKIMEKTKNKRLKLKIKKYLVSLNNC